MPCKSCKRQQELQDEFNKNNDITSETSLGQVRTVTRSAARDLLTQLTNNQILLDGWSSIEISANQIKDKTIGIIKVKLQEGDERPNWAQVSSGTAALKTLWRQWDRLEIKGDLLYRKFNSDKGVIYQLVTPVEKQNEVIKYHHDIATSGHLGVEKTLNRIRQAFYWPGMTESVKRYCRKCDVCAAMKLSRESNKAPLGQYHVGEPMERVMMDILGPLPATKNGNRYILVISDWFTKWTESVAISDMETKTVARAFIDNFLCRYGAPLQIYSDQGRCFESKLMIDLCQMLGIEKIHASPMRPQANGLVEIFNRTFLCLRHIVYLTKTSGIRIYNR